MKHSNYLFCSVILFLIFFSSCEKEEPLASFTLNKTTAEVDESISFTNTSTFATSYSWEFGDGNSSTNENPTHSYSSDGTFTVKLTATGDGGENSTSKTVVVSFPEAVASFTMDKTEAKTGETITFTNTSENASRYLWDFGDGSTSTNENPTHSYSSDGTFTVKLTATGDGGENSTTKTIVVEIGFNIFPGESAMNISLEESWATVQGKLASDYTQYGPLMISGGSGSVIIHPVESKSEGIMLYFISITGSMLLNSSDVVFLISLDEIFVGQTEKGIKMGSSLSDVEAAYGTPDEHDAGYSKYEYDIGIDFYYDSSSKIDGINISTPASSSKSTDISKELIMNHLKR